MDKWHRQNTKGADMREIYAQMIADSTPGRFEGESPMTAYVHELSMNGDEGDDAVYLEHLTAGQARYGRRVLYWSEVGFISLTKFDTVADACKEMDAAHAEWDDPDESEDE
jgi:hypothetical protein